MNFVRLKWIYFINQNKDQSLIYQGCFTLQIILFSIQTCKASVVKRNVFLRSLITFLPDSGLGRETVDGWFVYIFSDLTCRGRCWGEGVGWGRSSSCPCWSPRPPELGCSSCSTSAQSEAHEVHLEIDGQAQEESIRWGLLTPAPVIDPYRSPLMEATLP